MVSDYDRDNAEHEKDLARLFRSVYNLPPSAEVPSDANGDGIPMLNDQWKDMGFQQKNPRTDFRGGGHLSLLCLIYMCDNYPEEFQEMVQTTKEKEELEQECLAPPPRYCFYCRDAPSRRSLRPLANQTNNRLLLATATPAMCRHCCGYLR